MAKTPLRSGDVLVADATVFYDILSRHCVRRDGDPAASLELLKRATELSARFGVTKALLNQYGTPVGLRRPLLGDILQLVAELKARGKLFEKPSSAGRCQEDSAEYRAFPREDRFLLHVAAAVGARFIVTTDTTNRKGDGIPLGEHRVPLEKQGRLTVEVIEPSELLERITAS